MKEYSPFSPVDIRFSTKNEALQLMDDIIGNGSKTLLLISRSMSDRLGLEPWLTDKLDSFFTMRISDIPTNPSVVDISHILQRLISFIPEQIIAIGGGSCIDLAKAISALCGVVEPDMCISDNVRNIIRNKEYHKNQKSIDIIAVPTTSGTGSEVTKWATVWDLERGEKLSIDHFRAFPKISIVVPEFTLSMPRRLTLSTGLDALSHAMEAYWARSRTPLSQALALSSITRIKEYLPITLKNGYELKARKEMCLASLLAGLAFSITRTTACHSISYPLTIKFGIEHGFASAMTLVQVAERNEAAVPEVKNIYDLFGGKCELSRWLDNITSPIIKLNLSSFGVTEGDLDSLAVSSFTQGRMDNNPVEFSTTDVKQILSQVLR